MAIKHLTLLLPCLLFGLAPAAAQTATDSAALAALSDGAALGSMPAKQVFGSLRRPSRTAPRAIGTYAKGCLAGAEGLAMTGPSWQVMRPSRNRHWGHPAMVAVVERLAREAKENDGWNGLLVGDLAQPRGGPMLSGHASHQIGLDADVWLTEMPDRQLTGQERETLQAKSVVKDRKTVNRSVWTETHARLIRRAASYPEVARIFVHPPIKAELCRWASGERAWLAKVRPYYGHDAHFHIRIKCPEGSATCKNQAPPRPADGTGCGPELAHWLGPVPWARKKPDPHARKPKPAPPLTLAGLPAECRAVATAQ
jgi:penicillin-insensitive murein endopeptidase